MRKTNKKKLLVGRETVRALSKFEMPQVAGGSDNSVCYCPGNSDVNSCVAMCGI
jgi:hypothetical protein